MKIKKILILIISLLLLVGCTKVEDYSYDDILLNAGNNSKRPNVYRNGYKFYIPKGLSVTDASFNYAIVSSLNNDYYIYFDILGFNQKKMTSYSVNNNAVYSKRLYNSKIDGFVEINLKDNNKYLIEIMYNYAKIEVMVDEHEINKALINSISILNSIKYDSIVIEELLKDDKLDYTEEVFDMFKKKKQNSDILNYSDDNDEESLIEDDIKDTDFLY